MRLGLALWPLELSQGQSNGVMPISRLHSSAAGDLTPLGRPRSKSPYAAAASPPGSWPRGGGHSHRVLPFGRAGAVAAKSEPHRSHRPRRSCSIDRTLG